MFVLLNGSFGIGKTTVARLLVRELPAASIYDPEDVGYVLRRLPPLLLGLRRQPDDYQDMALWRRLIAAGARRRHRRFPIVLVPMAFTNPAYFNDLAESLGADAPVQRLCLVASAEVVEGRLAARARAEGREISAFERRRAAECIVAHRNPVFGTPIDASDSLEGIVAAIRRAMGA